MSFSEFFANAGKKLQGNGFANEIGLPALMFDIASIHSNDQNWGMDALNIAADTFRSTVLGASYPIRKPVGLAFNKVLMPTAMLSYETGGRILREPLSAALTTIGTGDVKRSWENRDEISPGQALAYLQSNIPGSPVGAMMPENFDIFDQNDRKVFQEDWKLRTLTGAYDTFFTTVTDPLGKIGKAAGLARKALVTRPLGAVDANAQSLARDFFMPKSIRKTTIISPETLARTINEGREEGGEIYNTLSWMAKSDKITIRNHPMVAESNDADTLAYLLGEAETVDDVADTLMATALKDTVAMGRLVEKRKDLAFVFDNIKDVSKVDMMILDGVPTNGIVDDINVLDAASDYIKTLDNDSYFRLLSTFDDRSADLTKRTFGTPAAEKMAMNRAERRAAGMKGQDTTNFPTVGYFQPTKYHPLVAVVNFGLKKVGDGFTQTPAGYIHLNDSNAFNEFSAFGTLLRRIAGPATANQVIDEHTQLFLQAGGNPELRSRVVESLEDEAIKLINAKLGVSDEAGQAIWGAYKQRRNTARQAIKDRKFLMTNDNVILKIPYLERQGANALPMVDLENYARVIEKNKGIVDSLAGGFDVMDPDSLKYTTGIINDMWKASVLLRLGYTVRNVTEAGMSILAKGYGLMALGDINAEGFGAWYNNRVRDVERLTDRRLVRQGLRQDSVALRKEFAAKQYEFMAAERVMDDLYAHLAAYERAYQAGKVPPEKYQEILEVFQELSGEWLYHGSPVPLTALDNTKPFAMTFSDDIANRYAESGIPTISASEIYKRLTGRAYPMPKNLQQAPGAPIGTAEVIEQMPEEEFVKYVRPWVGGFAGLEQQKIRGYYFNEDFAQEGLSAADKKWVAGLKRTVERSVINEDITVYRGITAADTPYSKLEVGQEITENGFTATSKERRIADSAAFMSQSSVFKPTLFEIKVPKGAKGLDIEATYKGFGVDSVQTSVNSEREVLLPAGVKFRVVSIRDEKLMVNPELGDKGVMGRFVQLEVIPPKRTPLRQPSGAMQTIAADMREGFINTVNNGNVVEVLNPQTGNWTAINPETTSQKLLVSGQFRVRKPGNQGVVTGKKVFGTTVDLRLANGNASRLGLADYPELKKILGVEGTRTWKPTVWKGKENQLLDWMRANGVGKLVLPDTKANGRSTVLVDPEMVDGFGNQPTVTLAERRLSAVKKQQQLLGDEARIAQIIEDTVANGGATVAFTGDVPQNGFSVAVRGATHKFSVEEARNNPQAWIDSVADHFEKNLEKFGTADHFGTWVEEIDGVPHIWAEPTNVIVDRATAVKLGFERNQVAVANLNAISKGEWDSAFVNTKGTGDVKASKEFALGKSTEANIGDVVRGTQGVRRSFGEAGFRKRVEELSASLDSRQYPTDGLINIVREVADGQSLARKDMEQLMAKLDARLVEEGRLTSERQIQGTGRRIMTLYDGTKIEVDDAFAGELGKILLDRTDNAQTYRNFVDNPAQLFTAQYGNMTEEVLSIDMPQYYSGYANSLNTFFRSPDGRIDPLIQMFLDNMRPEDVVAWLRKPENAGYAKRFNIDVPGIKVPSERLNAFIDAEDFVGDLYSAYQRYLPDSQIQDAFANGLVDEQWLRKHFANNPSMPDIIGRVVPTSPQARNYREAVAKVVDRAFHFLGSLPETTLARHPLARQVYRAEMKQRLDVELATKRIKDANAELSLDDINNVRRQAIEATRKEINRTLFTIERKSYAGEKMRLIMPFFNAWENTIRRWSGLAIENPAVVARAGQVVSSLRNQPNVVDADGNPTNQFSYDNKIVVPMPKEAISAVSKIPIWGDGMANAMRTAASQVSIPVRSLDLLFQGEVIAGFGPVVVLPVNEIVKLKPDLEDIVTSSVLPVLPFGPQEGALRQLFPPAAQKLASLVGQDEAWSRTFNTVYRYELIRYNLGDRDTMPTLAEVKDLSDSLYRVKMLSNLVMPFAAQYDSTLSFYTQQFRKLQQVYGSDAETLFLQMYPEMGPALVSSSYNPTGAQASQKVYQNTKKYKDLISTVGQQAPEMIGFLVNDPNGQYDFSEAVYAWQYRNSPVPGSIENYRQRRNPAELKKDANVKVGWIEFRKKMNLLDYQLKAQGYESFNESGAEELQTLKQLMISDLTTRNPDWAADYYSVDKGKWIYRMQSIQTMLTDRKWMADNSNRQVVQALAVYMNYRGQIARELANRKAYGAASTLLAKENADLDGAWNSIIFQLKDGSPEFEDFYNRFLQNDPVTLG